MTTLSFEVAVDTEHVATSPNTPLVKKYLSYLNGKGKVRRAGELVLGTWRRGARGAESGIVRRGHLYTGSMPFLSLKGISEKFCNVAAAPGVAACFRVSLR